MPSYPITKLEIDRKNLTNVTCNFSHRLQSGETVTKMEAVIKSFVLNVTGTNGQPYSEEKIVSVTGFYKAKKFDLVLPTDSKITSVNGKILEFWLHTIQLRIYTTQTTSSFISLTSDQIFAGVPPSAPRNFAVQQVNNTLELAWLSPNTNGSLGIAGYVIEYSKDGGKVWYSTTIGVATTHTYTTPELNNSYIFRLRAYGSYTSGGVTRVLYSPYVSILTPLYLSPNVSTGTNFLFDKSTWGSLSSPWGSYLTYAAEEWENHVRIQPAIVNAIRLAYPTFLGIKINVSYTSQAADSNGLVTLAYVPLGSVQGFNLNPNDPQRIKWATYQCDVVINTHPDADEAAGGEDGWRAVLTHELGHALGIGVVWQPQFLELLNKTRSVIIDANGNTTIRSQLMPHAPRWQLNGTFIPPWNRGKIPARYPKAQEAYNTISGYVNTQFPETKPRSCIPMMSSFIFTDENKRAHWAYEVNNNTAFTKTHKPIPTDIMSYGSLVGVQNQQITPLSVGVLEDIGYEKVSTAPSMMAYKAQTDSESSTGYSKTMTAISDSAIPREHSCFQSGPEDNEEVTASQVLGTIELDGSNNVKNIIINED